MRAVVAVLAASILAATPAVSGWFDKFRRGSDAGASAQGDTLAAAAGYVAGLPKPGEGEPLALAAHLSHQGHWTFVNAAGEHFTAATPDELKRAFATLAPGGRAGADARFAVYLSAASISADRARLAELPKSSELHLVVGRDALRLHSRGDGAAARLVAEVRPGILAAVSDAAAFREVLFQLARPLDKANIRVLAVEPGGPGGLAVAPRPDPATKLPQIDAIDPAHLAASLGRLRGQMVLLVARVDGEMLRFKPQSGTEVALRLADIVSAAAAGDVSIALLKSNSARQPGGRNWLWQRTGVRGLDTALERPTMADFLAALARPSGALLVTSTPDGRRRTALDIVPVAGIGGSAAVARVGDAIADFASELAGKLVIDGASLLVANQRHHGELDMRIVPWIDARAQFAYFALLAAGLLGAPSAWRWWQRLWPAEARADYAGAAGYHAAHLVRVTIFVLIFMPLVAIASAPAQILRRLGALLRPLSGATRKLSSR